MSKKNSAQDQFTQLTGTVIGQGFTVQAAHLGGSESESMRIDGRVVGSVGIGVLHLSDTGVIDGDVLAISARIAGRVTGNIECSSTLHLASTAYVEGDVLTSRLIVDGGAVIRGYCQTQDMLDTKIIPPFASE